MSSKLGVTYLDQKADEFSISGNVDFDKYFQSEEYANVKVAECFRDELKEHLQNPKQAQGLRLPWNKAGDFRIRDGETTLHTGYNGHRKSMVLGLIQLGLISQGEKCLSLSMEMKPIMSLERMLKQFAGNGEPTMDMHDEMFNFLSGRLFIYDQLGTVKWKRVVAVCRYAIQELGVKQCFIDSLMKCGIKSKDLETQAEFVDELTTLAKDTGAHIHLVAHAKKPDDGSEERSPSKYQVSGSADLTNMVDNVIIHHQKKSDHRKCDQALIVGKQRNPEGETAEPCYNFWFDERSLQLKGNEKGKTMIPDDWSNARFI